MPASKLNTKPYYSELDGHILPITLNKSGAQVLLQVCEYQPNPFMAEIYVVTDIQSLNAAREIRQKFPNAIDGALVKPDEKMIITAVSDAMKELGHSHQWIRDDRVAYRDGLNGQAFGLLEALNSREFQEKVSGLLGQKKELAFEKIKVSVGNAVPDLAKRLKNAANDSNALMTLAAEIYAAGQIGKPEHQV